MQNRFNNYLYKYLIKKKTYLKMRFFYWLKVGLFYWLKIGSNRDIFKSKV